MKHARKKPAKSKTRKGKSKPKKTKNPKETVIKIDASNNGISISHRGKKVDKKYDDQIRWDCTGGSFSILWQDKSGMVARNPNPFDAEPFLGPPQRSISSGSATGDPGTYSYTIAVYPDDDPGTVVTIDPTVDVIDTGGGPGGTTSGNGGTLGD